MARRGWRANLHKHKMNRPVDALYGGFVNALPSELRGLASDLPFRLGLAPTSGILWSEVFSHEVTLEAPALVAEAFPRVSPEVVRGSILGHALAVIEAFVTDRLLDGQIQSSPEILALSEYLRRHRDIVLEQVWPGAARIAQRSDSETRQAISEERALLSELGAATFEEYQRISLGKQSVGFPASFALCRAAGATESQVEEVRRALSGVWLGLQFEDDAADWEDDWKRGEGAWAVSLARRRLEAVKQQRTDERPTEPDLIRRRVFNMRVLYLMLRRARHQYRSAWRYSRALGAGRLSSWSLNRAERLTTLLPFEERHPGYVVRARKLAAWAAEVLS